MVLLDVSGLGSAFISGIIIGSLYALMAMGLALIYSTVRVLNFAHGSFFMMGAFIAWWLIFPNLGSTQTTSGLQLPFTPAFIISITIIFGLGLVTQRFLIRPLIRRPDSLFTTLIVTLSLATILEAFATLVFGGYRQEFPDIATGKFQSSGLTITFSQLIEFGVAIAVLILTQVFLKRTRYGLGMRAVAQDMDAATLCGISINRIYLIAFGIGALLAAIAGILLAGTFFVSPTMGQAPLTIAFIIVVFGGIGSITGTIAASFIIAFVQSYMSLIFDPNWALTIAFGLMVFVLIVRPQGLFGFKE